MEELIGLVVKKTGLPKETAQSVVKIVLDYLKKKLPAPVGGPSTVSWVAKDRWRAPPI